MSRLERLNKLREYYLYLKDNYKIGYIAKIDMFGNKLDELGFTGRDKERLYNFNHIEYEIDRLGLLLRDIEEEF